MCSVQGDLHLTYDTTSTGSIFSAFWRFRLRFRRQFSPPVWRRHTPLPNRQFLPVFPPRVSAVLNVPAIKRSAVGSASRVSRYTIRLHLLSNTLPHSRIHPRISLTWIDPRPVKPSPEIAVQSPLKAFTFIVAEFI